MRTYTSKDWLIIGALAAGFVLESRAHHERLIVEAAKYVDVENDMVVFLDKQAVSKVSLSKAYVRKHNLPFSFQDEKKVAEYIQTNSTVVSPNVWKALASEDSDSQELTPVKLRTATL